MGVDFVKLVLWLTTTLMVKEVVCVESCPKYTPYYCACSLIDVAEVKQLKMCYYDDLEKVGCHPCDERFQENINCNSCSDDICPICSLHSFGARQLKDSQIKEQVFVKFVKRHGIFYIEQLKNYPSLETKQNAKFDISTNENGDINQTGLKNNLSSKLGKGYSPSNIQKNVDITVDTHINYLNLESGQNRRKLIKFPNETNSLARLKFIENSNSMSHLDMYSNLLSFFKESENAKPLMQPTAKYFIPEFTLFENKRNHRKINNSTNFAHTTGKFKRDKRRKTFDKQKSLNPVRYTLSDKVRLAPFENLENENFVSPHISGGKFNVKTLTGDKCHFRSLTDNSSMENSSKTQIFNFHCSTINVSSHVSFNKYYNDVVLIEKEIQTCISNHSVNIFHTENKFELIKTNCNISLPLMVVLNFIHLVVDSEKESLRFDKIIEVQNSSLIDKLEFMMEISNLSRNLDKSVVHDKKIYRSVNGKLAIEIKFHIKESSVKSNINKMEDHKHIFRIFPLKNRVSMKDVIDFKNFNHKENMKPAFSNDGQKAKIVFTNSPDFEVNTNNSFKYLELIRPFVNILPVTTAIKEQINQLEHDKSPLILNKIRPNPFHILPETIKYDLFYIIDTDKKVIDDPIKYLQDEIKRRNLFYDLSKKIVNLINALHKYRENDARLKNLHENDNNNNNNNNKLKFYNDKSENNDFSEKLLGSTNKNKKLAFYRLQGWHQTPMKDTRKKFEFVTPNTKWIHKFTKITDGINKLNVSDDETENSKRLENAVNNKHNKFNLFSKNAKHTHIYDDQSNLREQTENENSFENLTVKTEQLDKLNGHLIFPKNSVPTDVDVKSKFELDDSEWTRKFITINGADNKSNIFDFEAENNKKLKNVMDNKHNKLNFFDQKLKHTYNINGNVTQKSYWKRNLEKDVQNKLGNQLGKEIWTGETKQLNKFEKHLFPLKISLPVEYKPYAKTVLTRKRRDTSQFSVWSFLNDTEKFNKFVLSQLSVLKLFILNPNLVQKSSQKLSDVLWFRYSKYVLIPSTGKTVQTMSLKDSDIFNMLNASIANLKKSKIYNYKCKTCSVVYKIMLDNGFKIDHELEENGKSSVVVLMNKPEFFYHQYTLDHDNQKKLKTIIKKDDPFVIQMNIDLLFLSSSEYDKLRRKNALKNNLLKNSPWENLKNKFFLRIPESFTTKSEILNFSKSKNSNKLEPIYVELGNKEPVMEELQNIVFALLTKMHKRTIRTTRTNHSNSTSTISPTIKSGMIELKENSNSVNVLKGLVDLKVPHSKTNKDRGKNSGQVFHKKKNPKLLQTDGKNKSFDEHKIYKQATDDKISVSIGEFEIQHRSHKVYNTTADNSNHISTNHEPQKYSITHSSVNESYDAKKEHAHENGSAEREHKLHQFVNKLNELNETINATEKVKHHEKSSTHSHKENHHANKSEVINGDFVKKFSSKNELGDNSTQNSVVENEKVKIENLSSGKQMHKPSLTSGEKINVGKQLEINTTQDDGKDGNALDNTTTMNQQTSNLKEKNLIKRTEEFTTDSGKFETNSNHESEVLKVDENTLTQIHHNRSVGNDSIILKEIPVVHEHRSTLNETANSVKNEHRSIREDIEYQLDGVLWFKRSLRDSDEDSESDGQNYFILAKNSVMYGHNNTVNETANSDKNVHRPIQEDPEHHLDGISRFGRSLRDSDENLESDDFPIHLRLADKDALHREKRSTGIPHNHWCPIHSMRRNGNLDCIIWTFKKKCRLECHAGYSYDGSQSVEMNCLRKGNSWKSDVNRPCSETDGERPIPEKPPKGKIPEKPKPLPEVKNILEEKPKASPPKPSVPSPDNDEDDEYYEDAEDYQDK